MRAAVASALLLTVTACSSSGSPPKPFAHIHLTNDNAADITIYGCKICGRPVEADGTASGTTVDTDWDVYKPEPLTYSVQINGGDRITCRPHALARSLPKGKMYALTYRVTPDGRCDVASQKITRALNQ